MPFKVKNGGLLMKMVFDNYSPLKKLNIYETMSKQLQNIY